MTTELKCSGRFCFYKKHKNFGGGMNRGLGAFVNSGRDQISGRDIITRDNIVQQPTESGIKKKK